ncbi:MAG: hypothetical protein FJ319_12190 [SAR202 cluster bacterium]|nr:hypothetical protein [SAR202 cluster bacterium]
MPEYQPIDISKWCNAPASTIGAEKKLAAGRESFRGLPFLIGKDGGAADSDCLVAPHLAGKSVKIELKVQARRLIFAHLLLETKLAEGGSLGDKVADYVIQLSDGRKVKETIRERFEIAAFPGFPNGTPGLPFRGLPDTNAVRHPRYEGKWSDAGRRQIEAAQSAARFFYLWAWTNPDHTKTIESIEIIPCGPKFVIGGITAGLADEHPFARDARRPAKITLKSKEAAEKPFNVDVSVDRGDATYTHPLPLATNDEFLKGPYAWGQKQNEKSSPAYVEISAVPSATVTVKQGDEEVGKVKWGDVVQNGKAETESVRIETIDPGKNWVNVRILDEETGSPVPCRVHFRSPEGVPYQPYGHHNQVNSNNGTWHIDVGGDVRLGQITYAYIDGTCQGWLPRGDVIVDISRGFEYEPLRAKVRVEAGQRDLTLRIKRWTNMNRQGWYSGDSHVHFLSPTGAHLESAAEDLNVTNVLQSQWGSLFTDTENFTGEPSVSRNGRHIVYVSQENRQHFMGHMILWGLKKPVTPWCSDGLGEAELAGPMETTLSYWADEAHAQGGWVVQPHFPNPNGEAAALIATGRLDGIEMIRQSAFNHIEWYRYLNCGYRLPLVGGTDKMGNDVPVGLYRTYAKLPDGQPFNYENWCKSVAAGRTFLSGGPLIGMQVEGKEVGDTLAIKGPGTVRVEAWSESIFPIHRLQIVQDGRVVAETISKKGSRRLTISEDIKITGHTWLAARSGGPDYYGNNHVDVWSRGVFAHTSPVYVACGGEWSMFDPDTARYMLTMIEGDMTYIREMSVLHNHGNVTHHHGGAGHIAYLEKPFIEARETLNKRIKKLGIKL